jgi:hypothetical protein
MSSFGKVKSSAKVLAFIGENAYIFFVKTDVNRPIPTLASNPNCGCSNGLRGRASATDTKTDTIFPTPLESSVIGANPPDTR